MKSSIKVIFSTFFLIFFINHILDFSIKYFKFASIKFINEHHLNSFYYFMTLFEMISIVIVFLKLPKTLIYIYDFFLGTYCIIVPASLLCIYDLTNGCPECHFISSSFISNQYFNTVVILFLGITYLYKVRDMLFKQGAK